MIITCWFVFMKFTLIKWQYCATTRQFITVVFSVKYNFSILYSLLIVVQPNSTKIQCEISRRHLQSIMIMFDTKQGIKHYKKTVQITIERLGLEYIVLFETHYKLQAPHFQVNSSVNKLVLDHVLVWFSELPYNNPILMCVCMCKQRLIKIYQ